MSIFKNAKFSSLKYVMGCHQFETIREINAEVKEVKCKNCGKEFGIYEGITSCLPLDDEMRNLYSSLIFPKLNLTIN